VVSKAFTLKLPEGPEISVDGEAALGRGDSGDIASRLGRPGPQNVAPTRSRLIEKGLIFSPAHGLTEFTVPHFPDFIRRNAPS
jgi:hypothetical protein